MLGSPDPLVLLSRALETGGRASSSRSPRTARAPTRSSSAPPTRSPRARPCPLADRLARGCRCPSYERFLRARGVLPARRSRARRSRRCIEWKELQAGRPPLRQPLRGVRPGAVPEGARVHRLPRPGPHRRAQARAGGARSSPSPSTTCRHRSSIPLPMVVVDLDGGGRLYLQVDRLRAEGEVDDRDARRRSPTAACTRAAATTTTSGRRDRSLEGRMKDQVAVIGVGCTKFGDLYDRSYEELICDAAFEAYADAGIDPDGDRGGVSRHVPARAPAAGRRRCRSPTRCASTTGRSRASRTTAPPAPTRSATPAWRSPPGVYDVVLVRRRREAEGPRRPRHPAPRPSAARARQHGARSLRAGGQPLHAHASAWRARRSPRSR